MKRYRLLAVPAFFVFMNYLPDILHAYDVGKFRFKRRLRVVRNKLDGRGRCHFQSPARLRELGYK